MCEKVCHAKSPTLNSWNVGDLPHTQSLRLTGMKPCKNIFNNAVASPNPLCKDRLLSDLNNLVFKKLSEKSNTSNKSNLSELLNKLGAQGR